MSQSNYTQLNKLFFQSIKSFFPINETGEKALARLGISNLRDLVFYRPVSYNLINIGPDLSQVKQGDLVQVEVVLEDVLRPMSKKSPLKMQVSNDTGALTLVFFNKIHSFIYSKLRVGQKYTIAGKIEVFDHSLQITHPEFIFKKPLTTPMLPVYPLTYGLVNKQLYGYICEGINLVEQTLQQNDFFDQKAYLHELLQEIKGLHFIRPCSRQQDKASPRNYPELVLTDLQESMQKLAGKELFANQASLARIRSQEHKARGRSFVANKNISKTILSKLGFELTSGQQKAIAEIGQDQASASQMMRLLQGDVGSGKTLVALLTMLNVTACGAQATLMVPTDLLSAQHYQFFCKALEDTSIKVALLTGKTPAKQRKQMQADLLSGEINILIGTHALFQEGVEFKDLGYIVIDEQHRFGVEQRLELIKKASYPDVLVMTATPIPRSLTLTMFGDMDVSLLKTKPSNRLPIITTVISSARRLNLIASLNKKLCTGEKLYWVCPLVDQSDKTVDGHVEPPIFHSETFTTYFDNSLRHPEHSSRHPEHSSRHPEHSSRHPEFCEGSNPLNDTPNYADVSNRFAELNKAYPGQVAMIHGKIKANLKDQIMQEFKEGVTKILVATTVIEVGIDVPDSTLIIIENAEKFGLAQLHQLRGRVGRGIKQSHCILMYNPKRLSALAKQRLEIMRESNDGFYIAEQDLILRGGGEILGTKQSGEPEFFFANLARDLKLLLKANELVKNMQDTASNSGLNNNFIDFQINLFARNKREVIKSG